MNPVDPLNPDPAPVPDSFISDLAGELESSAGGRAPVPLSQGWTMVLVHAPSLAARTDHALAGDDVRRPMRGRFGTQILFGKSLGRQTLPKPLGTQFLPVEHGAFRQHMRLAAYAVPVMAVIVASMLMLGRTGKQRSHGNVVPTHTYATANGQQATVALADGSRILLGPATTLFVTQPFDGSVDVHLAGQARFSVTDSPARLFRVHTGHAAVRVLGTTFFVRRYAMDHVARIVVIDGRVALAGMRNTTANDSDAVLAAGTLGTVTDFGVVQVTPHIVLEDYTGWTAGKLVFRDTPVRDAVLDLGRVYGADIRIADSTLATQTLNWTVPLDKLSLADVLEFLTDVLDAHVVRSKQQITIVPGRLGHRRPDGLFPPLIPEPQYGK